MLGELGGNLCQGLCRGNADADRNTRMATNGGADALSELLQWLIVAFQVEEGLVDRVDLNLLDLGA